MARDIASVADKDTRENEGIDGEVLSPPDGPRTDGGPAPRPDPDAPDAVVERIAVSEQPSAPLAVRAPEFVAEVVVPEPALPEEPEEARTVVEADAEAPGGTETESASADDRAAYEDVAIEATEGAQAVDSAPELASDALATEPGVHDSEVWRSAIADALAEPPPEVGSPDVALPSPVEQLDPWAAEGVPPSPEAHHELPLVEPHSDAAAAHDDPPRLAIDPPVSPAEPSFTSAAEDLFRPPAIAEEPHLVTLGRRLDPSLRIPRPEVPDIQARPAPAPLIEPDAQPQAKPWERVRSWWETATWNERSRGVLRYAAYAVGGYLALVVVLILLFRFVNPPGSMLMLTQLLTGTSIDRTWAPLSSISPHLVRAVIVSEDGRFCEHSGIDTAAIKEAIDRAARGTPRGASTISMQVTKNLFLWNAKSYVRKVIEIPLTLIMELVWPKSRVLEVYLNIAEWGPGVFGAEAAAQHHFKKSASRLSERESALLAAVLPNPLVRDAGAPNRLTSAKARVVQSRVKAYGAVASCVVSHAAAAPAQPTAAPSVVRPGASRKTPSPSKPAPQRKKPPPADDWAPTLDFGR